MAKVSVHQHRCPECSASLSIPNDAESVRCEYCGKQLSIEHRRPPTPAEVQPRTIYVSTPSRGARAALLAPVLPFVVLAVVFWPRIRAYLPGVGDRLPVECEPNGEVVLRDKVFAGEGTLVKADANCTVRLEHCTLTGDTIVEGGVNLKVTVVESALTARRTAIVSGANASIELGHGSVVRGSKVGLDLGANAIVHLDDSRLVSDGIALRADSNLSMRASGGELRGATAVEAHGRVEKWDVDGTAIVGTQKVPKH